MEFPLIRNRRLRINAGIRDLVAEAHLSVSNLIQPFFVVEGTNRREEISKMPGVFRLSIDFLLKEVKACAASGIKAVMLFPSIERAFKSLDAKEALNENNLICRAIRQIKAMVPDMVVFADVALDPYTEHGHDGIINNDGYVLNDETVRILATQALTLAKAGCDVIAPSDMMDGRIKAIRESLEREGYVNTMIASYSAKYASSFYTPFRDAVWSTQKEGGIDKTTYQMDYRNSLEAIREIQLDITEGADLCIIKPGLPYLDVVNMAKHKFSIPLISYQVSGEYSMLKIAAQNGILNYNQAILELLFAFKRAGCSAIITYGAMDAARLLSELSR